MAETVLTLKREAETDPLDINGPLTVEDLWRVLRATRCANPFVSSSCQWKGYMLGERILDRQKTERAERRLLAALPPLTPKAANAEEEQA